MKQGSFPDSFHNLEEYEGYITLDHYVRPYIRVSVTYDPLLDELKNIEFMRYLFDRIFGC